LSETADEKIMGSCGFGRLVEIFVEKFLQGGEAPLFKVVVFLWKKCLGFS